MERVERDYEELLRLFNKHRVRYCIVGAFAFAFYAVPRYTKDMDILIDPSKENSGRILKALNDFGFGTLNLSVKDFSSESRIIQLGYEPVRIDIITSIDGCTFNEVWENKKTGRYGKERAYFIGLNELIKNKKALKRKQDRVDLDMLITVKRRMNKKRRKF